MSETAKDLTGLRERIDALETRVAYQDDTIETLNATITAQWKQIEHADAAGRHARRAAAGSRKQQRCAAE